MEKKLLSDEIKPFVPLPFDDSLTSQENTEEVKPQIDEEQLKLIFEEQRQAGYKAGFNDGYNEGFNKGYQEGINRGKEEINQKINELKSAIAAFKNILQDLEEFKQKQIIALMPQILKLSMKIAEKIVAAKINLERELIISIIKEALNTLPVIEDKIIIKVNPEDYKIVSQKISELGVDPQKLSIHPSYDLKRGDCSLETQSLQVEAKIDEKLKEIENALNTVLYQ